MNTDNQAPMTVAKELSEPCKAVEAPEEPMLETAWGDVSEVFLDPKTARLAQDEGICVITL